MSFVSVVESLNRARRARAGEVTRRGIGKTRLSTGGCGLLVPFLCLAALLSPACATTQPWERETLAKRGVHWPSQKHPGYLCLRGFLVGDVDDVMGECARALATDTP